MMTLPHISIRITDDCRLLSIIVRSAVGTSSAGFGESKSRTHKDAIREMEQQFQIPAPPSASSSSSNRNNKSSHTRRSSKKTVIQAAAVAARQLRNAQVLRDDDIADSTVVPAEIKERERKRLEAIAVGNKSTSQKQREKREQKAAEKAAKEQKEFIAFHDSIWGNCSSICYLCYS
jgi:hypothetical protein